MKKFFKVLFTIIGAFALAAAIVCSIFYLLGKLDDNTELRGDDITTSIVSSDEDIDNTSSQEDVEIVSSKEPEEQDVVSSEPEKQEEPAVNEDKVIKAMYSSKKELKNHCYYILYTDGTWSYQSDSASLMITAEEDITEIKNRIASGELFEITEKDLNFVAAG